MTEYYVIKIGQGYLEEVTRGAFMRPDGAIITLDLRKAKRYRSIENALEITKVFDGEVFPVGLLPKESIL